MSRLLEVGDKIAFGRKTNAVISVLKICAIDRVTVKYAWAGKERFHREIRHNGTIEPYGENSLSALRWFILNEEDLREAEKQVSINAITKFNDWRKLSEQDIRAIHNIILSYQNS